MKTIEGDGRADVETWGHIKCKVRHSSYYRVQTFLKH